jgi:hypothetical protein
MKKTISQVSPNYNQKNLDPAFIETVYLANHIERAIR